MGTITIPKGRFTFKVLGTSGYLDFWESVRNNQWEEETFKVFDRFLDPDHSCIDVGAWIGPTVLYEAQMARQVYALEPDSVAFKELVANVELNAGLQSKIKCLNLALTDQTKPVRLYLGRSAGNSESGILPNYSDEYMEVAGVTLDDLIQKYSIENVNFIKIDIEGGEYFIIQSMRSFLYRARPTLYLSLHRPFLMKGFFKKLKKDRFRFSRYLGLIREWLNTERRTDVLTQRLLENLEFYKYFYDTTGKGISKNQILRSGKFRDYPRIVITDKKWS